MNIRDFPVMMAARIVTLTFGFLATLLLIRGLSQAAYGRFVFWLSLLSFTKILSDGSITPFYKYWLPQTNAESVYSTVSLGIAVKMGLAVVGGVGLTVYFATQYQTDLWLLGALLAAFVFVTLYDYLIGVLTGLKQFNRIATVEILHSVLKLALYGGILLTIATPETVLGGYTVVYGLGLMLVGGLTYRSISTDADQRQSLRYRVIWIEFRSFAPYQILNSLVKSLGGPVLIWVLIAFLGPVAVAQWNAILQFQRLMMRLLHPVREVLFPEFSDSSSPEKITIAQKYIKLCLLFLLPIAVGGMILATPLLAVVFGPEYVDSANAFRAILWTALFGALGGLPYFVGQGETRLGLIFTLFNRGLVLVLFTAGALYSLTAAAAGYALALLLSTVVLYWFIFREPGTVPFDLQTSLRAGLALLVMALPTIALRTYASNPGGLAAVIVLVGILYLTLVFRLGIITDSEKTLLLDAAPTRLKPLLSCAIRSK